MRQRADPRKQYNRCGVYRRLPTHDEIYAGHASEYDALVSHEDYQGNILRAVQDIMPPRGLDVLDLGAGTGRLARLLAPLAKTVVAFDLSAHMLRTATARLRDIRPDGWLAAAADHRRLPVNARAVDLIVSGWSVSYLTVGDPRDWRGRAETWLLEARRVVRPGGRVILFESLGTGNESPVRLPHLENFYRWLDEKGFASRWIRTDYLFEFYDQAEHLVGFFFGDEMIRKIRREPAPNLPECTGVWWIGA